MKVEEIAAATIITKSRIPGADYVINPYVGCVHSCLYCYATFMKRFTGHEEKWGSFVDVKVNASDLIPVKTKKYKNKRILLASVTDAYLSYEKKYRITRGILEKLIPLEPKLSVLTKSDLILRDVDLLQQFKHCDVGFTIATMDENIRKEAEPFASPIAKRIEALRELKKAGLRTYVFIGPILPFVTDWKAIIEATRDVADYYIIDQLNINDQIWNNVRQWLNEKHPELVDKYKEIYFSPSNYWKNTAKEIRAYCRKEKINADVCFGWKEHNKKLKEVN